MQRDWLGQDFNLETEDGLWGRLDGSGGVVAFGWRRDGLSIRVDVAGRKVEETTVHDFEDAGGDYQEWLDDWRGRVLKAGEPYEKTLCCAFCGKRQTEVRKLIAGPSCYICDECVELCSDILAEG